MSEQTPKEQSGKYVYKFSYYPSPPKATEPGAFSSSELQAYIDSLLGIKKEEENAS